MKNISRKEKDAILRMMEYIKFELIQVGLEDEAFSIQDIIEETSKKMKISKNG